MSSKPTILFIHGSWHNPAHFRPVRDLFEADGFPTSCPLQATYNASPNSALSLADDVAVIQSTVKELLDQGKDVIVIMHSYGGVLGSEAILEEYGKKAREAKGEKGGVIRLLYMCAFVLPIGSSLATTFGALPPFIKVEDNGLCMIQGADSLFYNDLPKDQQQHWLTELAPVPTSTQLVAQSHAAYKYYPSTYLYCSGDQGLTLNLQEMLVKGTGAEFETETCTAGHSPFLSQPQAILDIVKKWTA